MKLVINTKEPGTSLGDMFGIFFEDLNHAADGGLYAEMVRNRAFEFAPVDHETYHHLTAWEKIENDGTACLVTETGNPISDKNPHYLGLDIIFPGKDVGVWNLGYGDGMALEEGKHYLFSCYAKREQDHDAPLKVSLRSREGRIYAQREFVLTDTWQKYELELASPVTDYTARLAVTAQGRGKIYLNFISMFPADTYKGRKNGMRRDIAGMLEELHPKFMRFPGGCLVHCGSLDGDARDSQYRWKNTLGPVENRPARRNNWGYHQSLGIGYYEYFQFCEDIHTKPLPVLPAGYDPHNHRAVPVDKLKPWIDDALDLIEFANGGTDTVWGAYRAELGHPEPFGLEYIGIGNEEVGQEFFERYRIICQAVKEKYPQIKVIGTSGPNAAGGEFERGWACAWETGTDIVDEHYYQSPEWFLANHRRYDGYDREGPKVFLGEYASWGNTWYNALTESSYMLGMERNAGTVAMACYAPMLCNVNYVNWKPDMIWFNNHQVFGTANYYIQKLFMHHQGSRLLEICGEEMPEKEVLTKNADRIAGKILLAGYESRAEFSGISVTDEDSGQVHVFDDCIVEVSERRELEAVSCVNYTLKLRAKEIDGRKGFQIFFGHQDEENQLWWTLGGWQNQDTFIGERINGRSSDLSQYLMSIQKDQEYDLELRVRGRQIETWVDGKRIHCIESRPVVIEPLYYSASMDEESGDVILKVTNMRKEGQRVEICLPDFGDAAAQEEVSSGLRGAGAVEPDHSFKVHCSGGLCCRVWQMSGWKPEAENDFEHPELITPREWEMKVGREGFFYEFPAESFTVFRINFASQHEKLVLH